jgi:hypothetical protein
MQENASYEENELENRVVYTAYAVTLALGCNKYIIQ